MDRCDERSEHSEDMDGSQHDEPAVDSEATI